jgi:hypothetical protein
MPQKRKPKKPSIPKVRYPVPELITRLLCAVNMFEGTDVPHMERVVYELREAHLTLKNLIGLHPDYQDNAGLQKLDKAYKEAGWDENGLRWHTEDPSTGEDIFIVEFMNREHTKWILA